MMSIVSLLVAAALVSQQCGFEANANSLIDDRTIDQDIPIAKPTRKLRLGPFVKFWSSPAEEVKRVEGEKTILTCVVMGLPPPSVYWMRNGETLEDSSVGENEIYPAIPSKTIARVTSSLVVSGIRTGEDVYTCVAEAGVKKGSASTTVYTSPAEDEDNIMSLEKLLLPPAPIITQYYNELFQTKDTMAVLPCKVHHSLAEGRVYWEDNHGKSVHGNHRMKVLPSGDLLITPLEWSDMGQFTCIATNGFGKDAVHTFLYPMTKSDW